VIGGRAVQGLSGAWGPAFAAGYFHTRHQNLDYLRHLPVPTSAPTPPRQHPYEFRTYTVRVRLRAMSWKMTATSTSS
jgi:hypothetical protein